MANHNGISPHGVQRHRRIDQCFAFFDAGLRGMHVDNICAQSFSGNFEGKKRAGRIFKKRIDNGQARQPVIMLCRTGTVKRDPMFCLFQNVENFPFLKAGNAKQMPVRKSVRTGWKAVGGDILCPCH